MNNSMNKQGKLIKAAMFGGLLGAVSGLLLAPKSGKELRQDLTEQVSVIGNKAVVIKDKAQSAWQNVEEKTQERLSKSKNWIQKKKQLVDNLKTLVYEIQHGALTKTETIIESEFSKGNNSNPIIDIEKIEDQE